MAFPFALLKTVISTVTGLGQIIGGDKGKKVQEAGQIVSEVTRQYETNSLPPDKRMAFETELMKHEQKLKQVALETYRLEVENLKDARTVIKTALMSEDPYVRRARPTFLWLVYIILTAHYIVFPIIWMIFPTIGKPPIEIGVVLKYFLWAYLGYGGFRTIDKSGNGLNGVAGQVKKFLGIKKL